MHVHSCGFVAAMRGVRSTSVVNLFRDARRPRLRLTAGAVACSTTIVLSSSLFTPVAGGDETPSAAALASAVAKAQADVDALQLDMGALQERVNRAFVDLRDAQARAEQARRGADAAAERLKAAQEAVDAARADLESFSRSQYRGSGSARISALADDASQKDALDRAQYIRSGMAEKRAALEEVERARTEAANEESTAREALELAEAAAEAAVRAETDARSLLDSSSEALGQRSTELETAETALSNAEASLAEVRPESAPVEEAVDKEIVDKEIVDKEIVDEETVETAPVTIDPASIEQDVIEEVTDRVAELAPEAPAADEETVAEAIATAYAAEGATPGLEIPEHIIAQAASIVAATVLVGASQLPHATFEDPYASPLTGAGSSDRGATRSTSRGVSENYSTGEIVTAFAGGLQNGMGLASESPADALANVQAQLSDRSRNEQSASPSRVETPATAQAAEAADAAEVVEVSPSVVSVLPEVETPESKTEDVKEVVAKVASTANSAQVETVIARAEAMVGTPYVWGGGDANGPTTGLNGGSVKGFDCSGLVLYAFAAAGISLPHYTGYQYQRGTKIDPSQAQRGDLLFWGPGGSQHVAIYLGDGMMIEAPQAGQNVSIVPVRWSNMSEHAVRLL